MSECHPSCLCERAEATGTGAFANYPPPYLDAGCSEVRSKTGAEVSATIRRVARPRGVLTDEQETNLLVLRAELIDLQAEYQTLVVRTLQEGASFAEVSKTTGLSTNTLQRWKRERGHVPTPCRYCGSHECNDGSACCDG